MDAARSQPGEWGRAGALALVVGAFSITDPVALLLVSAAVAGLAFGGRDVRTVAAAGVALAVALALTEGSPLGGRPPSSRRGSGSPRWRHLPWRSSFAGRWAA